MTCLFMICLEIDVSYLWFGRYLTIFIYDLSFFFIVSHYHNYCPPFQFLLSPIYAFFLWTTYRYVFIPFFRNATPDNQVRT